MGRASDAKTLCEDIIASYDLRAKAIGDLIGDVNATLKGFAADRKKMSEEQARVLARSTVDLTKNVSGMIKGFQKEHKAMADELRGDLAKDKVDRLKGNGDRLKSFNKMMGSIRKSTRDLRADVDGKVKEFSDCRADMSEELRKVLAKESKRLSEETRKLLGSYRNEREKMAADWQGLAGTIARKREGRPILSSRAAVRSAGEAVAGKAKGRKKGRKSGESKKRSVKA